MKLRLLKKITVMPENKVVWNSFSISFLKSDQLFFPNTAAFFPKETSFLGQ